MHEAARYDLQFCPSDSTHILSSNEPIHYHVTERETLLVPPGDQMALTFGSCLECPEEGFWNPLVNQREEVGIQTPSEKGEKEVNLDYLYPGLMGYGIGKGWNEWPAWPFVPSTFHSSGWKWNGEMWKKVKDTFQFSPSLCASRKWFRLIWAEVLKTFSGLAAKPKCWPLAPLLLREQECFLGTGWLQHRASPAKSTSSRPL